MDLSITIPHFGLFLSEGFSGGAVGPWCTSLVLVVVVVVVVSTFCFAYDLCTGGTEFVGLPKINIIIKKNVSSLLKEFKCK